MDWNCGPPAQRGILNAVSGSLYAILRTQNLSEDLFLDTLKDIYFAEQKIVATLPEMEIAATNAQLKSAFRKHLDETKIHVTRLEAFFNVIGAEPEAKTCDAILGITDEGAEIMEEMAQQPNRRPDAVELRRLNGPS